MSHKSIAKDNLIVERLAHIPTAKGKSNETLASAYSRVRAYTNFLVGTLELEDRVVQSMPDASPANWHLAHTSWFFEIFVLVPHLKDYRVYDDQFTYLFNSYYETIGPRQPRSLRGLMPRPTSQAIDAYRTSIDENMRKLLATDLRDLIEPVVLLGIAHEEQHQELLLTDILHLFAQSPLKQAFDPSWPKLNHSRYPKFVRHSGGLREVGATRAEFSFDNEGPRHKVWLEPFEIRDQLVTNAEWISFMQDGGYSRSDLWFSDGWALLQHEKWQAPMYWQRSADDTTWCSMTLGGLRVIDPDEPVSHINYYEAAAFASWANARLPTEQEWEVAAQAGLLSQVDTDVWQWTQTAYAAYPGFRANRDAIGEYNGKFMVGQMVLRGGAQVTPHQHARLSYRNFFYPSQRWIFPGLRLARDAGFWQEEDQDSEEFRISVINSLSDSRKYTLPKYFYDERGSQLFEAICGVPEYYVTRVENELLSRVAPEIADTIRDSQVLVEFGSGASVKTKYLLDASKHLDTYIPVDISQSALDEAVAKIKDAYPTLRVKPVLADFTAAFKLPSDHLRGPLVGFFPGSTICNFSRAEAAAFLSTTRRLLGAGSRLIVGVDLVKSQNALIAAYDDSQGVTAAFNKNILLRINRELRGDFDIDEFAHEAVWNEALNRIEMHLVSLRDQIVMVSGRAFAFKRGESIHTESSHKFTLRSFGELAQSSGWAVEHHWHGGADEFAIFCLLSD